MMLFS